MMPQELTPSTGGDRNVAGGRLTTVDVDDSVHASIRRQRGTTTALQRRTARARPCTAPSPPSSLVGRGSISYAGCTPRSCSTSPCVAQRIFRRRRSRVVGPVRSLPVGPAVQRGWVPSALGFRPGRKRGVGRRGAHRHHDPLSWPSWSVRAPRSSGAERC